MLRLLHSGCVTAATVARSTRSAERRACRPLRWLPHQPGDSKPRRFLRLLAASSSLLARALPTLVQQTRTVRQRDKRKSLLLCEKKVARVCCLGLRVYLIVFSRCRWPGPVGRASLVAQLVRHPPAVQEAPLDSWVGKMHWRRFRLPTPEFSGFPCGSAGKEPAHKAGDLGLIPGLGRSPGEGKGYPLQYSGLENFMNCTHGFANSGSRLSDFHSHFRPCGTGSFSATKVRCQVRIIPLWNGHRFISEWSSGSKSLKSLFEECHSMKGSWILSFYGCLHPTCCESQWNRNAWKSRWWAHFTSSHSWWVPARPSIRPVHFYFPTNGFSTVFGSERIPLHLQEPASQSGRCFPSVCACVCVCLCVCVRVSVWSTTSHTEHSICVLK